VTASPLRLFCLPHAGGSASQFRAWRRWLPAGVDVTPVELPGHGARLPEPLIREWEPLVADLHRVVAERIDGPFALFGHSLGALLAFEIARTLERRRGLSPALLIAAGRNGPAAPLSHSPIHDLPDGPFLDALRRLGGIPDGVSRSAELMEIFMPGLRADMRLAERYTRAPGAPLSCPVLAFAGRQDVMTDPAGVLAWARETRGGCEVVAVDGGHFFLGGGEFTAALADRLARVAPSFTDAR